MKNTFKALRTKLRTTENKLNDANTIVKMQLDEINRLSFENTSKDAKISNLETALINEEKARKRLKLRLAASSQLKNSIYNNYMKEIETKNKTIFKYKMICLGLMFTANAVAAVCYVMIKG